MTILTVAAASLAAAAIAAWLAHRAGAVRLFLVGWIALAAVAGAAIARTLLTPDSLAATAPEAVPDFAVPNDVRGLQGTSGLDEITRERDGSLTLSGWIFDERSRAPGDAMYVDIDGTTRIAGTYGEPRPDVAQSLNAPAAVNVGFHVFLTRSQVPPGLHRFRLGIRSGTERFESVRRYVLRPAP